MKKVKKAEKAKKKKVLVCGAGSIGIYLGVKLNSKKHDVKLFGRRKLKLAGKEIILGNKKFKVPESTFKIPKNQKHDFIFIATKLYDFEEMVKLIKKNNVRGLIICAIQNGLVDTSKCSKILERKIVPITVFSGLNLSGNRLQIHPTPVGWKTDLSKEGKEVSKLLADAGIPCSADKNFDSLRAEKTIVNCCLNTLSAIENKTFYSLFENKKTRERIEKLFDECYDILKKKHKLDKKDKVKRRLFNHWSKLKHYSSTCQDLHSGRPVETPYFNGYILKLGEKYKIPAENNKKLVEEMEILAQARKR